MPMGAPGEITFSDRNNLIVQDHTYNKLWMINIIAILCGCAEVGVESRDYRAWQNCLREA